MISASQGNPVLDTAVQLAQVSEVEFLLVVSCPASRTTVRHLTVCCPVLRPQTCYQAYFTSALRLPYHDVVVNLPGDRSLAPVGRSSLILGLTGSAIFILALSCGVDLETGMTVFYRLSEGGQGSGTWAMLRVSMQPLQFQVTQRLDQGIVRMAREYPDRAASTKVTSSVVSEPFTSSTFLRVRGTKTRLMPDGSDEIRGCRILCMTTRLLSWKIRKTFCDRHNPTICFHRRWLPMLHVTAHPANGIRLVLFGTNAKMLRMFPRISFLHSRR